MWQNDIFGMTSEDDVVTLLNIYCSSMAEKKQGMYCSSMLEKKNPNRLFTPKEKKRDNNAAQSLRKYSEDFVAPSLRKKRCFKETAEDHKHFISNFKIREKTFCLLLPLSFSLN